MRASVLGTGHCLLPPRARVKVGRSAHFRRQPGRQPACMHCMHKHRLTFSDLSSDHACRILAGWLAGWLAGSGKPGSNGQAHPTHSVGHDTKLRLTAEFLGAIGMFCVFYTPGHVY